jgi:ribosome-associated heat shock protein Hsp15
VDRQRVDKWLWHARVVRTRGGAAELVTAGHVRINGVRVAAASHLVRLGDVVTVALDRRVRLLKATGYAVRRGSADDARGLFEDLTPPAAAAPADPPVAAREPGAGRPTKRERRELDQLLRSGEFDSE